LLTERLIIVYLFGNYISSYFFSKSDMKKVALLYAIMIVLTGCSSQIEDNYPTAKPDRIISLAPSNTEILFALGLEEKVVGVTEYCDYPKGALRKEKIGGFQTVNVEKVVSLEPDLVFATGGIQKEIVRKLENLGLSVVVLDAEKVDDILENIMLVGMTTGSEKEAKLLVEDMKQRIEVVEKAAKKSKKPRVAYLLWGDPLIVAGNQTFMDDLIRLSGGENVFSNALIQYPEISFESLIEMNPEILINGDHSKINKSALEKDLKWMQISAVKNNRVYTIDADTVSRPGPRIVDALELFSKWIAGEGAIRKTYHRRLRV
jgi:iron complex transport system substrate-binding protein